MYAIRNCEEVDEEIAYFRNGQSCCVAESTTVDITWRVKPDALVPYLRTLQGLEFPGFASGPDIDLDRLNLDNLRSLRHLNVFHPSSDSSSGISLWDALKGAGVALISLCCNEVTDALIDYLMSFSGLQELDIRRIKATSNKMNHAFFNQVLPKHAPTLTKLYLRVHPIDGAIEGWCYDPGSWVLVFPLFLRLGYLHIHPPPLSPRDRALNRIASMKANYQAILNGVQGIRTLQQLEIFVPSIPRTVVRGLPRASKQLETSVVLWPEDRVCEREWLLQNIPGASGVLLMLSEKVNSELLDAAGPSLRVVSTMSVGYEHIDRAEVAKRGVKVGYTPDVLTDAVADLSVMLALMAGRNAGEMLTLVKDSQWPSFSWAPFSFCGPQLSSNPRSPSRTVGFLGFGRISQATLARLIPFGVTRCIYSSNPKSAPTPERDTELARKNNLTEVKRVDLDELARESDVLFVLAPGGEETRHLINEPFLKKMKKHSVLVNTARGTLVDSDALAKALREGWIWGAGLDVVEGEPKVTADHPLVKEPRCVVLPHIGSATFETRWGMATLAVNNLLAGLDEQPLPAQLQC
ncbi:hypothetical protein AX16_006059 [Volvariella volvacea WC 439]|nr:hypothetical protein AX16_006059 [Volvariella volvacea WC 439]